MKKSLFRVLFSIAIILVLFLPELETFLTLDGLQATKSELQAWIFNHYFQAMISYFLLYTVVAAASIPGITVMTLSGGAFFGWIVGSLLAIGASSVGSIIAFWISRYFLRRSIEKKFSKPLEKVNKGIKKEGFLYLLSIRMIPIFPYFMVNLLMGVTRMKTLPFWLATLLGMTPGLALIVYAGTRLEQIHSLNDIFDPPLVMAIISIGILPLLLKRLYLKVRLNNA